MAREENQQEPRKKRYPLDASSYRILDEIGVGVSATVYKAVCIPLNATLVAIKSIDLDQSRAAATEDLLDSLRRETKTMSLLSHPNILQAHCSFTVDHRLWVVMPFMSGGSLQSIISSAFPHGLPEPCIAVVLKETLNALSYLHNQGHLHRDIKAGNILVDAVTGQVKLADFGVSASIYETNTGQGMLGGPSSSCSGRLMLTDVAGTPYWMAPEVIHSHVGYSFKADIWSFGITAMELAHGKPPLSHLPPSVSLLVKITKRFRFSDFDKHDESHKSKKFSKSFKEMVASCLDPDPSKRPTAEKLLEHSFFKNCKGHEFLVRNLLHGLPSVEERFRESKSASQGSSGSKNCEEEQEEGEEENLIKTRRISGWNFNEEGLELDPVFPSDTPRDGGGGDDDDSLVMQDRFGCETIGSDTIGDQPSGGSERSSPDLTDRVEVMGQGVGYGLDQPVEQDRLGELSESNTDPTDPIEEFDQAVEPSGREGAEESNSISSNQVRETIQLIMSEHQVEMHQFGESIRSNHMLSEDAGQAVGSVSDGSGVINFLGLDRETILIHLRWFKRNIEEQKRQVVELIRHLGGEVTREDQLPQIMQRLKMELEVEKSKNHELEMELRFLKDLISGTYDAII